MKVLKNSALLSFGLLLGRGIGYIRELLIAHNHGATKSSDLIILALTVPEFVSNILSTGLATNVVVPRLHHIPQGKLTEFLKNSWSKLLLLSIAGLIGFSGFALFYFPLTVSLILIFSCLSLFPNAMTALTSAYLTYKEKFRSQALSNLVFNVVATLGIFFFTNIYFITSAFIVASIVRFLFTLKEASDENFSGRIWQFRGIHKSTENDIRVSAFLLSALSSGLIILNPLIARLFAAKFPEGSVSILSYAEKLYILPLTLLISPYLTASFSKLSRDLGMNPGSAITLVKRPLGLILTAGVLVTIISVIFADQIVLITFGFSGLTEEIQKTIATTFRCFIPGLIFSSASLFLNNVFFSLKQEKIIAYSSLASVLLNFTGYLIIWMLIPDVWALATVTTLASIVVFLFQLTFLVLIHRKAFHG